MSTARGVSILVVSGGKGADQMGSALVKALMAELPGATMMVCPLRGKGEVYRKSGVPVVGVSSGRDMWLTAWRRGRFLQHLRYRVRLVIVIGGMQPLLIVRRFLPRPIVFIPTFSLGGSRYFGFWLRMLRKSCALVVPQDETTAAKLRRHKIPAVYLGSLLMDCIQQTNRPLTFGDGKVAGILPGAREEAYQHIVPLAQLAFQLQHLRSDLVFLVSVPSELSFQRFAALLSQFGWSVDTVSPDELADGIVGKLHKGICTLQFMSGGSGDVMQVSDICLSTDPIASEQASGLGKPVVVLLPEKNRRGKLQVRKLLGQNSVSVVQSDISRAARTVLRILDDESLYYKLSVAGKVKMGGQGVAARISKKVSALVRT